MISVEDLAAALANLLRAQTRLNCWPVATVYVNRFGVTLNPEQPGGPVLRCTLPDQLLRDILDRKVHWNNAEIGCLIKFDRQPNVYMPDVHTLMSFFHLPRESK